MKYIPIEFLNEQQLQGKIQGMKRDIEKYPNSPFKMELAELEGKMAYSLSDNKIAPEPVNGWNVKGEELVPVTDRTVFESNSVRYDFGAKQAKELCRDSYRE